MAERRSRGRRARALAIVATLAAVTGCGQAAPDQTAPPSETAPAGVVTAPLTGEPVDAAIDGPSVAAKIDDHSAARPQIGLGSADIVFEELVEGGLTRYLAVWHSDIPDEIGPVRSVRPMDPGIVAPFGGIMAYSGGQDRFVAAMQRTDVLNVIHGGEFDEHFHRTDERIAPHDVVLDAAALAADESQLDAPQPQFAYPQAGAAPTASEPATSLDAAFSGVETRQWACDAATGLWMRSQNGVADLDEHGEQLSAANVVVIRVDVVVSQDIPESQVVGSGDAMVLSGCAWTPATWEKADEQSPIELTSPDGSETTLTPGATWVELVPNEGAADVR